MNGKRFFIAFMVLVMAFTGGVQAHRGEILWAALDVVYGAFLLSLLIVGKVKS